MTKAALRKALNLNPADTLEYRRKIGAWDGAGWYLCRFGQSERRLNGTATEIAKRHAC